MKISSIISEAAGWEHHGKIGIGTKFIRKKNQGKNEDKKIETIVDIYTTTNSKGEVVKQVYVASHGFMGQNVVDYDVPKATVAQAKIIE